MSTAGAAVAREAGARLRGHVRASIVRRQHLDIEREIAAVDVVLDPHVRKHHVPLVVARQVVVVCPVLDLTEIAVRTAVGVLAIPIARLKEFLVLRLQFVLENDSMDMGALVSEPLGFLQICPIELRVVLQFARSLNAVMKCLSVTCIVFTLT